MPEQPALQQIIDQCDRECAAIDARLAEELGGLDKAAEMALPFAAFWARQMARRQAAAAKTAVIEDAQRRGGAAVTDPAPGRCRGAGRRLLQRSETTMGNRFTVSAATWPHNLVDCDLCGEHLDAGETGISVERPNPPEEQDVFGETRTLVWHLACALALAAALTDVGQRAKHEIIAAAADAGDPEAIRLMEGRIGGGEE